MPQIDITLKSTADVGGFTRTQAASQNLQRTFGQLEGGFVRLERALSGFRPENIIRSFMGGLGIGSAFAAVNTVVSAVDAHFKQAEANMRALEAITRRHEESLDRVRRMGMTPTQRLWEDRASARDQQRTLNALRTAYGAKPNADQIEEIGKRQAALDALTERIREQERAIESKAAAEAKSAEKDVEAQRKMQERLALERQRYEMENEIRELEFRGEKELAELKKGELFRLNEVARLGPEITEAARRRWAMEAAQANAADRRAKESADAAKEERARRVEFMRVEDSLARDLARNRRQQSEVEADASLTDMERRERIVPLIETEMSLLADVVRLKREERGLTDNPIEQRQLEAEIFRLREQIATLEGKKTREENPATKYQRTEKAYKELGDPSHHYQDLSAGALGGMMNFVTQLGTMADQVAQGIEQTLGAAVNGITQGIMGWINGTMTFRQALANIGQSVLQSMLQTIVQMGAQWLVNAALVKTGLISIEATGDAMRAARVAKENAAEAATLPAKTAGAAASGISSFGVSLAFGLLAVALIASLAGGFAEGGVVRGPGTGTSDSILARLSNGEGVLTARAMSYVGEDWLNQLNADPVSAITRPYHSPGNGASPGALAGGGTPEIRPTFVFLNDPQEYARMMQENSEAWFYELFDRANRRA